MTSASLNRRLLRFRRPGSSLRRRCDKTFARRHTAEPLEQRILLAGNPELLKDIAPGFASSTPSHFTDVAGTAYFAAADVPPQASHQWGLWKSDGSESGTALVRHFGQVNQPGPLPNALAGVGGILFFNAPGLDTGTELWTSDGTAAGTVLVKDINPGLGSSNPGLITDVGGVAFFTANDGASGVELWKSDGSEGGTVLVKDIAPGGASPGIQSLTNVAGTLFFTANDGSSGVELWKSDGTPAGTVLVKDIRPGLTTPLGSSPEWLTNVDGTLFFSATTDANGRELWKSDGTEAGTVLVRNIQPDPFGPNGSTPTDLHNLGGTLFFSAVDSGGRELWKSQGTAASTVRVRDINPGGTDSSPSFLTSAGGTLFFRASDATHGLELWKSDGTETGTVLVADLNTTTGGVGNPGALVPIGNLVFFRAFNSAGLQLYQSDGTQQGTVGLGGPPDGNLTRIGGNLYFSQVRPDTGREPWIVRVGLPPIADAGGPYSVVAGRSVTLHGTGSDPDGGSVTFAWDLDGDGAFGETGAGAEHGNEVGANPTFDADAGPASVTVTLRVADDDGHSAFDTATVGVGTNHPPTADAGGPYFVFGGSGSDHVQLVGSGTDPEGGPLVFAWDLDNDGLFGEIGIHAREGDEVGSSLVFDPGPIDGVTVSLRVTDDVGQFGFDDAEINIINGGPTADAGGPYFVTAGPNALVQLSGAGSSDPEGFPLSFHWDLDRDSHFRETGPQAERGDEVGPHPMFDARGLSAPTTIIVVLVVADDFGKSDLDTAVINILPSQPPTADAGGPYSVIGGHDSVLSLDGAGTDPEGGPLTAAWDLDGDGTFEQPGFTPVMDVIDLRGPATMILTLRVTDATGQSDEDTATLDILPNQPPIADAGGPYVVIRGQDSILSLDGDGIDPEGDPLTAAWDLDGDGLFEQPGFKPVIGVIGLTGQTVITFRVTDKVGQTDEDTATIHVLPRPPIIVWTGASQASDLWSDPGNWQGIIAPLPGDDLVFPATAARFAATNDFPAGMLFDSITIQGGGYDLDGNGVQLGEGGVVANAGSHTLAMSADIVGPLAPVRAEAGSALTMSGVIGGNGLLKQGAGTLVLAAANTYSGLTRVDDGTLVLRDSLALGTAAAGTELRGGTTLILEGGITVGEDLTLVGDPPGAPSPAVSIVSSGDNTQNGKLAANPNILVTVLNGTLTIAGVIDGEDDLTKDGAGALALTADNTLVGTITLLEGALKVLGSQPLTPIVVEAGSLSGGGLLGPVTLNGGRVVGAVIQASPIQAGKTDLLVGGTAAGDQIEFRAGASAGTVEALLDNASLGTFAPTGRLIAYGLAGNDGIKVARSLGHSAWLYGGAGADWLVGGGGHDVLLGDEGIDLLIGGRGRDLLAGGDGSDAAYGGAGDDILIAATLRFAHEQAALGAIMAEWTSARSYTTRLANLLGDTANSTPDRHNGQHFLTSGVTVLDDTSRDVLWGGLSDLDEGEQGGALDRDWYFADTSTYDGRWLPEDIVIRMRREVVTELDGVAMG